MIDTGHLQGRPSPFHAVDGWLEGAGRAAPQVDPLLLEGRRQPRGFGVCIRSNHADADHRMRVGEAFRGLEIRTIELQRLHQVIRREVRRKRERHTQRSGELRAEKARPQQPDRHVEADSRDRAYLLARLKRPKVRPELLYVAHEVLFGSGKIAAERARCRLVRAWRPPDSEVDPVWIQRLQRAELFRDDKRCMVREHYTARAYADAAGSAGHVSYDDGRRGARDAGHIVVLGQPVAVIPPALR